MDHYEEGTFTPTYAAGLSSITYGNRSGRYTKIGNRVYFDLYITNSAGTGTDTRLDVGSLPFTSSSSSVGGVANFQYHNGIVSENYGTPMLHIPAGNTIVQMYYGSASSFTGNTMNDKTVTIYITGTYEAA